MYKRGKKVGQRSQIGIRTCLENAPNIHMKKDMHLHFVFSSLHKTIEKIVHQFEKYHRHLSVTMQGKLPSSTVKISAGAGKECQKKIP